MHVTLHAYHIACILGLSPIVFERMDGDIYSGVYAWNSDANLRVL
jgi:hypothetical protein